ncbi:hypothetical protein F1737_03270 [Methanoplanus sp. FWC-SCC4]|uniref:Uncharacterized protein n=1 Tax=Methanochimaera problematica TaxID=2609417 RepID=A0AA97FC29_9EURY|nr:hypothetical protein [Methanoplanus sp. FWC-SCC4]WOF15782.1 hypothetical protein F1737_03270 [Methanoplanus sp. FWC-SCC4]
MTDREYRRLKVEKGKVQCLSSKKEDIYKCRFCVHSVSFLVGARWIKSPARAFCTMCRTTEEVDLLKVESVECDDLRGEGFRSMMNVIS